MSTNEIQLEPIDLSIQDTCVHVDTNHVDFCIDTAFEVTGYKREYAIVGDAYFATVTAGVTPPWMVDLINDIIDNSLNFALGDIDVLKNSILEALRELDVAKNQYQELINIEVTIDSIIASRLATLNANLAQANAQIIELQIAKVTPEMAVAIAIEQISAQLNSPTGDLYGAITNIRTSITSLNGQIDAKYADLYDLNDSTAYALSVEINRVEAMVGDGLTEDSVRAIVETMNLALASDVVAIAQSVTTLRTDMDGNFATVNSTLSTLTTATSTNSSAITTLNNNYKGLVTITDGQTTAINANTSAISGLTTSISTINGNVTAVADSVTTLRSDMNGEFATVNVSIGTLTSSVGSIGAHYTVKLVTGGTDPAGGTSRIAGGFELLSNGSVVTAGWDVDQFWVGRAGSNGKYPFSVVGGVVYIDTAMIQDASITNAKIGNIIQSNNYVLHSAGWQINKNGDAEFNNIYARGDIRASSLTANLVVTNSIRSTNFNLADPNNSPGWAIYEDGRAFFNGAVISRPNVIVQGDLSLPATSSWALAHYSLLPVDGEGGIGWTTQVGSGLLRETYINGQTLRDVEFIVDLSPSDYPNASVWSTSGPLLGVSCVVTSMDNYYSGSDPGAPYSKVGCSGTVERTGDLTSTSFIRIRIRVPLPDALHGSMRGFQIRNITWALLAVR
jgi:hypothetical protein